MNEQIIHIACGFDNNFCAIASVMMLSLAENCNPEKMYVIHVLHDDINDKNKVRLNELLSGHSNVNLEFHTVAFNEYIDLSGLYESRHVSRASYYRLLMTYVIDGIDKVLYVDPDTVVLNDVSKLFEVNTNKAIVGSREIDLSDLSYVRSNRARDVSNFGDYSSLYEYFSGYLGFSDDDISNYLNAGVLLFDLKKIRELYQTDIIEILSKNIFMFHDQDIINYIFKDDRYIVDIEWNFPNRIYTERRLNGGEISILHAYSTDNGKPWISYETSGAHLFWSMLRNTPYYEEVLCRHLLKEKRSDTNDLVVHINKINGAIKKINQRLNTLSANPLFLKKIKGIKSIFRFLALRKWSRARG